MKYFNIIVFTFILLLLGGLSVINYQKDSQLSGENRQLADLPELTVTSITNGSYVKAFEASFSDRFVMRENLVGLSKTIEDLKSFVGTDTQIVEYQGANVTEAMGDSSDGVKETKWGKILIYEGAAMEINTFHEPSAKAYAESINAYTRAFPDLDIYSLLVPTQIEFIEDETYSALSVSQRETVATTNAFFVEGVQPIEVFDAMAAHTDEYLYFRTDHHWTQRGAYYAFQEIAKVLNQKAPALGDYKRTVATDYLGSLYNVTLSPRIAETPDTIEVFYPTADHTYRGIKEAIKYNEGQVIVDRWLSEDEKYATFLGGDQAIVEIESSVKNGVKLLVLKDSYANALVPYFVDIAETIIVVDPRMYEGSVHSIVAEYGITDILFVNYALITRWDGYSSLYRKVLEQ